MPGEATILWAEDDENDVLLFRRAFEKAGLPHRLIDVSDGREAVDYLAGEPPHDDRTRFPLPDLLVLDLKMPRLGGFEVLAWIQERPEFKRLPAVVMSSSNQERDIQRARGLGAADYFVKPCGPSALVELLLRLDARWLRRGGAG